MKKIAVIISGGGMNSIYTAGSLTAMKEIPELQHPDIMIAASGSAGTAAYYVAEQYDYFRSLWLDTIPNSSLVQFTRFWKVFDIDYLIDTVMKKQSPLDLDTLHKSSIDLYISAIHTKSGALHYFTNQDGLDFFQVLKASCALPILYNKTVEIEGEQYTDGICGIPLLHIPRARELGAEKIIIIDNTQPRWYTRFWQLMLTFKNKTFKQNFRKYRKMRNDTSHLTDPSVFVVKLKKADANLWTRNPQKLQKTFEKGYDDMKYNKALLNFITEE